MEADIPVTRGDVTHPQYPRVNQEAGDHYQILLHAAGQIDLDATEEGRAVIARYKADADLANGPKPPRIPEPGELPPSHLTDDERADWLKRQDTQALLPGEEG
jgi:hypothetical protein